MRKRINPDRPLTKAERVQRSRQGKRRLEVSFDPTSAEQIGTFAEGWKCSVQDVLKYAWMATLPAMKKAHSREEFFDLVRDALASRGME